LSEQNCSQIKKYAVACFEFTAFDCRNARSASGMGHSRPMHSAPVPINVRCYSNSDMIVRRSEVTLGHKRTFGRYSQSSCLKRSVHRLLGVGLRHLAYQLGPIHIHRSIDRTGLGPTVVFENFDHQRRVVRQYNACLQHP
jgi:hypothetical protein